MNLELNLYATMIGSFGIILIGYFFGRLKVITPTQGKGISLYMVYIALPALIFKAMVTVDFKSINWMLWGGIFVAKTFIFIVVVVLTVIFQKEEKIGKAGLYGIFVTQSNDFAFGIPIIESIFSPTHRYLVDYIYLVAPISLAFLNPIAYSMMEYEKAKKNIANDSKVSNSSSLPGNVNRFDVIKKTILITLKGIITNPLVFMLVFGIAFNFIFQQKIPMLLSTFINNISSSFGATALFYLGWSLGSKETPLGGLNYLLPIVLVVTKGILLPIVMKTTVLWMVRPPGNDTNIGETHTQGTFGFIYGTIPTAPSVVVFASIYGLSEDVVASGLVFGTILCAPILFASIQMIRVLNIKDVNKFCRLVTVVSKDISILNIACCVWVLCIFFILRLYRRTPHCCTLVLICFQLAIGLIGSFYDMYCNMANVIAIKVLHWLLLVVMYGYCAWTVVVAISMSFVSTAIHGKIIRWLVGFGVMSPLLLATIVILVNPNVISKPLSSPYFMISCYHHYDNHLGIGGIYVAMNILVLSSAVVALIRVNKSTLFENLFSKKGNKSEEKDPLIRKPSESERSGCYYRSNSCIKNDKSCIIQNVCSCDERNEDGYSMLGDILEAEKAELTITGYVSKFHCASHVILVLLMGFLSIVNLAVALWFLVSERNESGLYLELQMLGAVLTCGQGFFSFMTFGFLKELFLLPFFERFYACFGAFKKSKIVRLPDLQDLDPDVIITRNRFMQNHYEKCVKDIAKDLCLRENYKTHNQVFKGTSLVDWLINSGILDDRSEAVAYGNKLLSARIIKHVTDERFFYDLPYFYEFTSDGSGSSGGDGVGVCGGDGGCGGEGGCGGDGGDGGGGDRCGRRIDDMF